MANRDPQLTSFFLLLSCGICAAGPQGAAQSVSQPSATVVIVSGISKDPNDQALRTRAVAGLREYLLRHMRVDPQRLTILAADSAVPSTASQVAQTIETLAPVVRPEDRFIFYYIGQANAVGGELRFNLPGPDMTQKELADRLSTIKAGTQLVVLDCPCAALAAKALAAGNRIVVCASTATQAYGTRFSAHFVHSLAQAQTDVDNDGRVSLLEAFTAAAKEIEQWYRQNGLLPTETPCLDDDGDGAPSERPWKHQTEGGDGAKASTFVLTEGP
ncbi:MAG: hypothetical protein JW955_23625 [Sedimentisphaerales bacterium]|nr:hypothetical protein [Sedimentisphaerales bacterium]